MTTTELSLESAAAAFPRSVLSLTGQLMRLIQAENVRGDIRLVLLVAIRELARDELRELEVSHDPT